MALESGRKLGLTASLIYVVSPAVAIVGVIAFLVSLFASAGTRSTSPFLGLSIGFIAFIVAMICVAVAGFIMFMVAMYRLSNYYNEPGIFKNVLYAFIINIVMGVVIFVLEFVFLIASISPNFTVKPAANCISCLSPLF